MDDCVKCKLFIHDWFTQPLSPKEDLYEEIHPKRLERVLPRIAPIFIRLIKDLTYYDLHGIFVKIEGLILYATVEIMFEPDDIVEKTLLRLSWTSMADHYLGKAPNEIRMIEDILKDECVCKGCEKELIGYYLTEMITNLKDVHSSHGSLLSASLDIESHPSAPPVDAESSREA